MSDKFSIEFSSNNDICVCVDAIGLRCPMPLIKMKQALNCLQAGDRLLLRATDEDSVRDIYSFIRLTNHRIAAYQKNQKTHFYIICKGH